MVIPTTNPVIITAVLVFLTPKKAIRPLVIFWAAPLSATNFPSIAPSPKIMTKKPKVLPIPFSMEVTIVFSSIPCPIPIAIDTSIKAINALSLKTMINKKRNKIPREMISNGMC